MDEFTEKRAEKFRLEAIKRLITLDMPEDLASIIQHYLDFYQRILADDDKVSATINSIELMDLEQIDEGIWSLSAEGVHYFSIALDQPIAADRQSEPLSSDPLHGGPYSISNMFVQWMVQNSARFITPENIISPALAAASYLISYFLGLSERATRETPKDADDRSFVFQYVLAPGQFASTITLTLYPDFWKNLQSDTPGDKP